MDRQILDLVAGVDPVPDENVLLADEGDLDVVRRLVKERSIILRPPIETTRRAGDSSVPESAHGPGDDLAARRPRRTWQVTIAVGVAAAIVLFIAFLGGAFDSADEVDVDVVDVPDAVSAFAAEALAAADEYVAAFEAGDVGTLMELSTPLSSSPADQHMYEYHAEFVARGMPMLAGECEVIMGNDVLVIVECVQTSTDPVLVALGSENLVLPLHYDVDGLIWRAAKGGDLSAVNAANAEYLIDRHLEDYDLVCNHAVYERAEVIQNRGMVLTGACAELAAPLADQIAQWIRDGRPQG